MTHLELTSRNMLLHFMLSKKAIFKLTNFEKNSPGKDLTLLRQNIPEWKS